MCEKRFPNGFQSWIETHFEIVSVITNELRKEPIPSKVIADRHEAQGTGGMYELAEELTDEFEKAHELEVWENADYFETIDKFIHDKLYPENNG